MRSVAAIALCLMLASASFAQSQFLTPDDDLPEARVGQFRVAFTRNGAVVVGHDGKWLFDSGLVFWTKSWENWGTQIRRAKDTDAWSPLSADSQSIHFDGTLFSFNNNPRYTFQQDISAIPGGLHFHYKVAPLDANELKGAGIAVQLPVAYAGGGVVALNDKKITLSSTPGAPLGSGAAKILKISLQNGSTISYVSERPFSWSISDQRKHRNPTFSLFGSEKETVAALNQGKPTEFSFDLILEQTAASAAPQQAALNPDPKAPVIVLPDDVETRGDWIGKYGKLAYVLCAMRSPNSIQASRAQGWRWDIKGGSAQDSYRLWKSAAPAKEDRTVLLQPDRARRVPASIDDHGEAYDLGQGPDLHLRCSIPRGMHQLSLYFFETDWIQYRAFDISIYSDDKAHQLLAKTDVSDFFKGKYKRFQIQGPRKLHIHLDRCNSTNVVISGIFLDAIQ